MKKRASKRIPVNLQARLFWGSSIYPGIVTNLSENGMFINTKMNLSHDTVLEIVILMDKEVLKVPISVRWTRKIDDPDEDTRHNGIGVELLDVPQNYLEFVRNLKSAS